MIFDFFCVKTLTMKLFGTGNGNLVEHIFIGIHCLFTAILFCVQKGNTHLRCNLTDQFYIIIFFEESYKGLRFFCQVLSRPLRKYIIYACSILLKLSFSNIVKMGAVFLVKNLCSFFPGLEDLPMQVQSVSGTPNFLFFP